MKKSRMTKYLNGTTIKLKNKRVTVINSVIDNEEVLSLEFRIATTNPEPRASCEHVKGRAMFTTLNLSKPSAEALMIAIYDRLNK